MEMMDSNSTKLQVERSRNSAVFKKLADVFHDKAGSSEYVMSLCTAALLRSNAMLLAMENLVNSKNYIAASVLLRVQMDTVMRTYGLNLTDDVEAYVESMFEDKLNKFQGVERFKLNDVYLRNEVTKVFPDFKQKYKQYCGNIHFSESHLKLVAKSLKNNTTVFTIDPNMNHLTDASFEVLVNDSALFAKMLTVVIRNLIEQRLKSMNND